MIRDTNVKQELSVRIGRHFNQAIWSDADLMNYADVWSPTTAID